MPDYKASDQRRATQNASPDILFEPDMLASTPQSLFLGNRGNKARLISHKMTKMEVAGISCSQSRADAAHQICTTALTAAHIIQRPVVLVGTDTDLLVMLIDAALPSMDIYMQFPNNPVKLYDINSVIQSLHPAVKRHLLFAHAITGCDTVSALFGMGKQKALSVLERGEDNWVTLDIFKQPDATRDEIAEAGEKFLLKLYGATQSNSLDKYRYVRYMQQVSNTSLTSAGFKLESLPPTSAAAKFHAFRTYHTVQQWLGNDALAATDWGWQAKEGALSPVGSDQPVAPDRVLRIVSCGCKAGCGRRCKCQKAGLYCTPMCSTCMGQTCANLFEEGNDMLT